MNILFVTCWYPDEDNPGFGIFIKEQANAISKQPGINLKVLRIWPRRGNAIYRKEIIVSTDENGIETHQVFIFSFAYKLIYLFNNLLKSIGLQYVKRHIINSWQPDIIHGNVVFQAGIISAYLAAKLKIPFGLSEHWSGLKWYLKTPYVQSAAGVSAYRSAKCIFPVSHYLKEMIQNTIGGDLSMQVVPNVVDTSIFTYKDQIRVSGKLKLLCVTNFKTGRAVFKLPGIILEALELMTGIEREIFEITFVGGGDGLEDFKYRIESLGYSTFIRCLGFCQKSEIAKLMQSSDALIHPSKGETFGVVVAEALCCGLPCIVSDVPALDELIGDFCGMRVKTNSAENWKTILIKFESNNNLSSKAKISEIFMKTFGVNSVGRVILNSYRD